MYKTDVNDLGSPQAALNIKWEREFFEGHAFDRGSLPTGRELLVFEGDAHVIRALQTLTEGWEVPYPPRGAR